MKTIIAGSRTIHGPQPTQVIFKYLSTFDAWEITEDVCGLAKGPDLIGKLWAEYNDIPVKPFEPDWSLGKAGGILRNQEMGDYADACLIFWDGQSKGTQNMIHEAHKRDLDVLIVSMTKTLGVNVVVEYTDAIEESIGIHQFFSPILDKTPKDWINELSFANPKQFINHVELHPSQNWEIVNHEG